MRDRPADKEQIYDIGRWHCAQRRKILRQAFLLELLHIRHLERPCDLRAFGDKETCRLPPVTWITEWHTCAKNYKQRQHESAWQYFFLRSGACVIGTRPSTIHNSKYHFKPQTRRATVVARRSSPRAAAVQGWRARRARRSASPRQSRLQPRPALPPPQQLRACCS